MKRRNPGYSRCMEILGQLTAYGPATPPDLCRRTGHRPRKVQAALSALRRHDLVAAAWAEDVSPRVRLYWVTGKRLTVRDGEAL